MTSPIKTPEPIVEVTAAKAWVAAVGATLVALQGAVTVVSLAANDGQFDGGEIGGLVTTAITLVLTVWRVWATPNKPVS